MPEPIAEILRGGDRRSIGEVARAIVAAVAAITVAAAAASAQSATAATLAIEHVTVLPMDRDTALADHTILVSGDRIGWLGPSRDARVPAGARRVNGRGAFVVPGLADMHVHLESVRDLQQLATAHRVRFVPLEESALARLVDENTGLMRLTLPALKFTRCMMRAKRWNQP